MHRCFILHLIVTGAVFLHAETVNLGGTVSNKSGKPIAGAVVTLSDMNLSDTTDADGIFLLTNDNVAMDPVAKLQGIDEITLSRGRLSLQLTKAGPVQIALFDLQGKCLNTLFDKFMVPGEYRFDLTRLRSAAKVMLIRVVTGSNIRSFRYLPLHTNIPSSALQGVRLPAGGTLARIEAFVASLNVTAPGYQSKIVPLFSYQDEVDITLDTFTLNKFSFFVTSLKALQELSGSEDGFGGDLRFGKTGPGAGLLGADSICQCIAERSMPGSKVKGWRAFLSVSSDVNGKQVNAIDRIGQGPWYDRLGRLLAPTLKDLLNDRPMNGDETIKNDLPNEDGVPNHRPDPTMDQVDNHHMITGTGSNGKLYSASATCDDWTSISASKGPHGGLSWPRMMGGMNMGSNWMSGLNCPGCKPGVAIVESGGPPQGSVIIGAGGGYGGFYCFALTP